MPLTHRPQPLATRAGLRNGNGGRLPTILTPSWDVRTRWQTSARGCQETGWSRCWAREEWARRDLTSLHPGLKQASSARSGAQWKKVAISSRTS
jgi:hypothetical protein